MEIQPLIAKRNELQVVFVNIGKDNRKKKLNVEYNSSNLVVRQHPIRKFVQLILDSDPTGSNIKARTFIYLH
jgi:hypothetical protein